MRKNKNKLQLSILDDGVGINKKAISHSSSLGLTLIEGLVKQLQGTFEYKKVKNGTAFLLEVSIPKFSAKWENPQNLLATPVMSNN